jgi:hypothetical protein
VGAPAALCWRRPFLLRANQPVVLGANGKLVDALLVHRKSLLA